MKTALVLLLTCLPLHAQTDGSVFSGLGVSLGRGRRVTARITFDGRKAAGGGLVFAAARTSAEDEDAIRMSEAVVTTSGGLLSHAAVAAREYRVPALILRARWEEGSLALEIPVFGPRKSAEGFEFQLVEKTVLRRVKEEDVVTVDSARGTLRLYSPSEGQGELELAQALRAYDGLRDAQSLVQWFEARAGDFPDPSVLGARLLGELAERVSDGAARVEDFDKVRKSVEAGLATDSLKALRARERAIFSRELRSALSRLSEIEEALREAGSARAAERLEAEARARWARLRSLADVLGARTGLAGSEAAYSKISRLAKARLSELLKKKPGSLSEILSAAGIAVPESVSLPPELYRRFVAENGLEGTIADISSDASLDLKGKSQRIRALILAGKLEPQSPLGREILSRLPEGEFYAVMGGRESRRFLRRSELLAAVKEAWAEFWSPASLGARKRRGLALEAGLAIEKIVPAEVSGVVFTREPGSGSRERQIVNAVFGEMEGLRAAAAFDQYVLDRSGREILPALVADKRESFQFDPASMAFKPAHVPAGLSLRRTLSPAQLERLSRAARVLDNHFGYGLELEFALAGEKFLVLSARPIGGAEPPSENPFALTPAAPIVPVVRPVRSSNP